MMKNLNLEKCKSSNKGITLIALVITIIVLLILAGVTISQLTGSDSAPAKANEAKQKDAIGSMKDEISIFAQNKQMEAYEDVYVGNSATSGGAKATVGRYVINALKNEYKSPNNVKRGVTISISQTGTEDAEIVLTTTDWKQKGTVEYQGGVLTWKTLEANTGNSGGGSGGNDPTDDPEDPNDGWSSDIAQAEIDEIKANGMHVLADASVPSDLRTSSVKAVIQEGNIPIPVGYYYVEGTSDTGTLPTNGSYGVVIADAASNGNEWVWVPVANATVLYEEYDSSSAEVNEGTKVASIDEMPTIKLADTHTSGWEIYDDDDDTKDVYTTKRSKSGILSGVTQDEPDTINYREPEILSAGGDTDSYYYSQAGFSSASAMAQAFVDDYDAMITSITKYGGFYVGRYELAATTDGYGSVDVDSNGVVKTPMVQNDKATANYLNWYQLYEACTRLGNNSTTTSTMMWGCQWDVMTNWIGNPSYDDDRHTGGIANTGANGKDKFKNIYDLEGNCYEWTQAADGTGFRAYRGGNSGSNNYLTVSSSSGYGPCNAYDGDYSSRPTLYIK